VITKSVAISVCFLIVAVWPLYENAFGLFCVDSGGVSATAAVVLGGGTPERQNKAVELYKAGRIKYIFITGSGDLEKSPKIFLQNGISENKIIIEEEAKSTWENAVKTVPLLRERGITNVILVTSWFHSRRALWTFEKVAPDIKFYSNPTYWGARRDLWKPCGLRRYIILEFIKTPWYWIRGMFSA